MNHLDLASLLLPMILREIGKQLKEVEEIGDQIDYIGTIQAIGHRLLDRADDLDIQNEKMDCAINGGMEAILGRTVSGERTKE